MKRPLIKDFDRWATRVAPDSFIASSVKVTIAMAHLSREIGNYRIIKWIMRQLERLDKYLTR